MRRPGLVGRSDELSELERLVAAAADHPRAAFISGDPGMGKSRLLQEMRRRHADLSQLHVAGYEPEQAIPFAAAREMLRGDSGPVADEISGPVRLRVCEAVDRRVAAYGAVLLTIDDLPWVDADSIALCHYLLRGARGRNQELALLVASRPHPTLESFRDSLTRLLTTESVATVDLGPLPPAEASTLVRASAPGTGPEIVERIVERANGVPLWLELLAQAPEPASSPERVVRDRILGFDAEAVDLLLLLALAGRGLLIEEVGEINAWTPERVTAAADALTLRGIAVAEHGQVRLAHGIVAEAALTEFGPTRGGRLRARLATWLEEQAGDDVGLLLEALDHRRAARLPNLDLALRLATHPRRGVLGAVGLARLGEIADDADDSESGTVLRREVAALAAMLGEHRQALERFALLADSAADAGIRREAALGASRAALVMGEAGHARRHLDEARALGGEAVTTIEVDAHDALVLRLLEHRAEAAGSAAARALEQAKALHTAEPADVASRRALVGALTAAIELARLDDDVPLLASLAAEQAEMARGLDGRALVAAQRLLGFSALMLGNVDEAELRLTQAWEDARRRVLPAAMLETGSSLALALEAWGRLGEAQAVARECLQLGWRAESSSSSVVNCTIVDAGVSISRGSREQGYEALRTALEREHNPHVRIRLDYRLATALARFEDHADEEVHARLADGWRCAERATCIRCRAELVGRAADATARLGEPAAAAEWMDRWPPQLPEHDRFVRWWRARGAATVAAAEADDAIGGRRAAARLTRLLEDTRESGFALEATWVRIDLASVVDDRAAATDQLRTAGADAERLGAISEQRVVDQRLRALGVRTWRRSGSGPTPLADLTEREHAVARLVATGESNPEIASALYLSRRTVERHVSNILAKLGLRNRTELAAVFADQAEGGGPHP